MTAVPFPEFTPNGFSVPEDTALLLGVKADWNAAFGGELNTDDATPQGQLAVSQAAAIARMNDVFLALCNQVDPAFADGRMQDALARLYFLERQSAEPTTVLATCTGAVGTAIPSGALAKASDGRLYLCTSGGTIGAGGTVNLSFECVDTGPVALPTGALNTIYRAIPGWDAITNAGPGVLGRDVESRLEFEERRRASVALNALGILPAIRAAVLNVPNVLDAYVTENATGSAATVGGVSIPARSLYVSTSGGASAAIAKAIWRKKPPGCAWAGTTTVTVTDDESGYAVPLPTYSVKFTVCDGLSVLFAVQLSNGPDVPSDVALRVQNAIIGTFSGAGGGLRPRIGSQIFALRFYSAIQALGPWARPISIAVGGINDPLATVTGSISGATLTISAVASGAVAIGQTVLGSGVTPGTIITAGSGTSWTVSRAQTIASQPLVMAKPTLTSVTARIDQVPTIDAANIAVTLV